MALEAPAYNCRVEREMRPADLSEWKDFYHLHSSFAPVCRWSSRAVLGLPLAASISGGERRSSPTTCPSSDKKDLKRTVLTSRISDSTCWLVITVELLRVYKTSLVFHQGEFADVAHSLDFYCILAEEIDDLWGTVTQFKYEEKRCYDRWNQFFDNIGQFHLRRQCNLIRVYLFAYLEKRCEFLLRSGRLRVGDHIVWNVMHMVSY